MRWSLLAKTALVIEAYGEAECPGFRSYSCEVEEGDLSDVAAGDSLEITLVNEDQLENELATAPAAEVGPDRESPNEEMESVDPDEQETKGFPIPEDVDGIHEAKGTDGGTTGAENGASGSGTVPVFWPSSWAPAGGDGSPSR